MNLSWMTISGMKIGMKLGLGFALLVVILSALMLAKLSGMSNDVARIDTYFSDKELVSKINALANNDVIFSMGMLLSDDSGLHANPSAQIEEMNSSADHPPKQALHGWCQLRGQHLSAG